MATLPERKPCGICGNMTRFTLDNGTPCCRDCVEDAQDSYKYAVRMPAPCRFFNCFDSSIDGVLCYYHKSHMND